MADVAGVLLTGGTSRRMGFDKAELQVEGERLVDRASRALDATCSTVIEVGPGYHTSPSTLEDPPGAGPLAALGAGAQALRAGGHAGPVMLLAVDLPFVSESLLRLIAEQPDETTVVPMANGVPQLCCARYSPAALDAIPALLSTGQTSLRALLAATLPTLIYESEWRAVAPAHAFHDLDSPEDLVQYGIEAPR
jgi:molybdenum cofactor guanylyltransferase